MASSSSSLSPSSLASIESPLIRHPLEYLRSLARDRRALTDEMNKVMAILEEKVLIPKPLPSTTPTTTATTMIVEGQHEKNISDANATTSSMKKVIDKEMLQKCLDRLLRVKRKLAEVTDAESDAIAKLYARLYYLNGYEALLPPPPPSSTTPFPSINYSTISARPLSAEESHSIRMNRLLVDHMARSGYHETAKQIADKHNIGYLVDSSLFAELQHILEDLRSHKTSSALEWCAKNRSKLKRIDSRLEFNLRCQDLIEMARHAATASHELNTTTTAATAAATATASIPTNDKNNNSEIFDQPMMSVDLPPTQHQPYAYDRSTYRLRAVQYARKYLAPFADGSHEQSSSSSSSSLPSGADNTTNAQYYLSQTLQETMATLVYGPNTEIRKYKKLYQKSRWADLSNQLLKDMCAIHSLPSTSYMSIYLQAGLSALKSYTCGLFNPFSSLEDPMHVPEFQLLAQALPFAKHNNSKLLCFVTKERIHEDNPPMVLPNGYVYSRKGIDVLISHQEHNTTTNTTKNKKNTKKTSIKDKSKSRSMNYYNSRNETQNAITTTTNSSGTFYCPRTGDGPYTVNDIVKAFIS